MCELFAQAISLHQMWYPACPHQHTPHWTASHSWQRPFFICSAYAQLLGTSEGSNANGGYLCLSPGPTGCSSTIRRFRQFRQSDSPTVSDSSDSPTVRQSDSVRQRPTAVRQSEWCTRPITARKRSDSPTAVRQFRQPTVRQHSDSVRQHSDSVRQFRQFRQPGLSVDVGDSPNSHKSKPQLLKRKWSKDMTRNVPGCCEKSLRTKGRVSLRWVLSSYFGGPLRQNRETLRAPASNPSKR